MGNLVVVGVIVTSVDVPCSRSDGVAGGLGWVGVHQRRLRRGLKSFPSHSPAIRC